MTTPRVVGLDLSITAPGFAYRDGSTYTLKARGVGDTRLIDITNEVIQATEGIDLVVIEDLLIRTQSAGITGMVHGAVRHALIQAGITYALIPPSTLKKYATGKGGAGKPEMAVAAYKRLGLEGVDDNRVDAAWLRAAGLDHLGHPVVAMPAAQRAALTAVKWPAVTTA